MDLVEADFHMHRCPLCRADETQCWRTVGPESCWRCDQLGVECGQGFKRPRKRARRDEHEPEDEGQSARRVEAAVGSGSSQRGVDLEELHTESDSDEHTAMAREPASSASAPEPPAAQLELGDNHEEPIDVHRVARARGRLLFHCAKIWHRFSLVCEDVVHRWLQTGVSGGFEGP